MLKKVFIWLLPILIVGTTVLPTSIVLAHTGTDDDNKEHAAQDLAGTSILQIENTTAQNAQRIQQQTGRKPGQALNTEAARTFATASADPGISGQWSSVINTEVVPIFQAILPNGKVLMWDSVGDNAAETYTDHSFTRALVWDPTNNTFKRVDVQGSNIFCAGFSHLANGNILVAGGNKDSTLAGTVETHIFNWQTETWTRGNNMVSGRWYPAVAEMANGEAAIVGGGPAVTEIYQTNGTIRSLPGFTSTAYGSRAYPFMISRPDTLLGLIGPYTTEYSVSTAGNGAVVGTVLRDAITRDYGSFATYDIGKTLVVGGGKITEGGTANVPTKTAVITDSNAGLAPKITATGSMSMGRRQFNATVLADGSILATGGETSAAISPLVDLDHAATAAERWDPATGTWTTLASAARIRQYHSTATLLPDGRVLTGGGGVCGTCMHVGYLEKNIEYFSPPYLYKKDGSGQLATRPVITAVPASISINTGFTITSSQATGIKKVGLVALGNVTHGVDQGQKYIPLTFSSSGTTLSVTGPPTSGVAPPGQYMLFITDATGVPSMAKMVQVAAGPQPLMSSVKNPAATNRCIDVPGSSLASRTYLQIYTCNNTKAQALTRLPNDSTLRILGNCVDVPSSQFVSGKKLWMYACNGTAAQKWEFRSDGTIRPIAKNTLCLTPGANAQNAPLLIATCSGSTLQKWAW